jgi:hypothetical protein
LTTVSCISVNSPFELVIHLEPRPFFITWRRFAGSSVSRLRINCRASV